MDYTETTTAMDKAIEIDRDIERQIKLHGSAPDGATMILSAIKDCTATLQSENKALRDTVNELVEMMDWIRIRSRFDSEAKDYDLKGSLIGIRQRARTAIAKAKETK